MKLTELKSTANDDPYNEAIWCEDKRLFGQCKHNNQYTCFA